MLSADNPFYRQVVLLVELLPLVVREPCFALKGGTAINLFVRDLPRLSVDIDLIGGQGGSETNRLQFSSSSPFILLKI